MRIVPEVLVESAFSLSVRGGPDGSEPLGEVLRYPRLSLRDSRVRLEATFDGPFASLGTFSMEGSSSLDLRPTLTSDEAGPTSLLLEGISARGPAPRQQRVRLVPTWSGLTPAPPVIRIAASELAGLDLEVETRSAAAPTLVLEAADEARPALSSVATPPHVSVTWNGSTGLPQALWDGGTWDGAIIDVGPASTSWLVGPEPHRVQVGAGEHIAISTGTRHH